MKSASPKLNELTQKQVHQMAFESIEKHLSLNSKGPQSSAQMVWNILLAAAANNTSIDYECSQHEGAASANTILGVLEDSFEVQTAEAEVNEALWHYLDPRCWKHAVSAAVDLVAVPYYGQPASDPNEVRRGKAEQGTTHFHVFATVYVIRKNRRVTLALHYVRKDESLVSVLDTLKGYLDQRGIRVKLWLADRAFCSVAALQWFDQQPEAIVPMVARGKQDPPSGSRVFFEELVSHWTDYTMHSDTEGQICLRVAVARRYGYHSRRQGKRVPARTLVYVVVGKKVHLPSYRRSVHSVMVLYRHRFGIESSYRQMNQARLRTSSRSPTLRLLAAAIAFLLRNLWALCGWMTLAHSGPGRRGGTSKFRLETLLRWISKVVDQKLGLRTSMQLPAASAQQF
jgi:putative transposase